MSADNGIYILATKGKSFLTEYRVIHAQAIENINWQPDESGFNMLNLWDYFKDSEVFFDQDSARKKAQSIYKEIIKNDFCPIVEYGICEINALNIEFPNEQPPCCNNPIIICVDEMEQCSNCGTHFYNEEEI